MREGGVACPLVPSKSEGKRLIYLCYLHISLFHSLILPWIRAWAFLPSSIPPLLQPIYHSSSIFISLLLLSFSRNSSHFTALIWFPLFDTLLCSFVLQLALGFSSTWEVLPLPLSRSLLCQFTPFYFQIFYSHSKRYYVCLTTLSKTHSTLCNHLSHTALLSSSLSKCEPAKSIGEMKCWNAEMSRHLAVIFHISNCLSSWSEFLWQMQNEWLAEFDGIPQNDVRNLSGIDGFLQPDIAAQSEWQGLHHLALLRAAKN